MNIIKLSQQKFKNQMKKLKIDDSNVEHFKNNFFICLNSSGWMHSIPYFKENHFNVINLYFDDVEISETISVKWFGGGLKVIEKKAMSKDQATELVNFINQIPKNANVYVYCAKGKSRSGAVEDFLSELINHKHELNANSNKHVYKLLKENYNA